MYACMHACMYVCTYLCVCVSQITLWLLNTSPWKIHPCLSSVNPVVHHLFLWAIYTMAPRYPQISGWMEPKVAAKVMKPAPLTPAAPLEVNMATAST